MGTSVGVGMTVDVAVGGGGICVGEGGGVAVPVGGGVAVGEGIGVSVGVSVGGGVGVGSGLPQATSAIDRASAMARSSAVRCALRRVALSVIDWNARIMSMPQRYSGPPYCVIWTAFMRLFLTFD